MLNQYNEAKFDRKIYADGLTRFLHSAIVILIGANYFIAPESFYPTTNILMLIIVAISFLYDFVPLFIKKFAWLGSAWPTVMIHYTVIAILLIFYVPPEHPYVYTLLILLVTAVFWLGSIGFWASVPFILAIFILSEWYQSGFLDATNIYQIAARSFLTIALGVFVERYTYTDVQERKKLVAFSEEANIERQRLVSLINSMADAVIAITVDGVIRIYNGASLFLLDTNEVLDGKNLRDMIRFEDTNNNEVDIIKQAKDASTIIKRDDLHFISNDNDRVDVSISISPIRINFNPERESEGFICIFRDITKEKTLDEQRDEFISIVSHELRTPIAITEANISTALLPKIIKDETKLSELLHQAHKNIMFLASLVSDITTLAHAERGDLAIDLEYVKIPELISEIEKNYQEDFAKKNLKLETKIDDTVTELYSSEPRIKEILQNYVTNALKYSEKGTVQLIVKADPDRKGVIFEVKDTGIGISQSDKPHIFEKFYRSEDYRTRQSSGTGLGLYVSKKLAQRMGGNVWLESKINKGSSFFLEVPSLEEQQKKAENKQSTQES